MPKGKVFKILTIVATVASVVLVPTILTIVIGAGLLFWNPQNYTRFLDSPFEIEMPTGIAQAVQSDYSEIYALIENSKQTWQNTTGSTGATGNNSDNTDTMTDTSNPYSYPETILPCTKNGDDMLILVNKQYQLSSTYAPSDLVAVSQSGIRTTKSGLQVRNVIIPDLTALVNAVQVAGIDLAVLSAYRSYATQQSTYNYWVGYNGGDSAAADTVSARAGHSQHQLGTAVDFTTNEISDQLGQQFANTAAEQWLTAHAWEYGFALGYPAGQDSITGYSYEPWHFRYIGVSNAQEWHDSRLILELWLREKN
ncbi:MAG: M15 family metallopeptidase [Patescibacteria group bacterium]|nr:M15 family metallopeptidase [Patescibacteria group bacterium]